MDLSDHAKLSPDEARILSLFILMPPPVSLDLIISFSAFPPTSALALLDKLEKKDYICSGDEYGIGHYLLRNPDSVDQLSNLVGRTLLETIATALLGFIEKNDLDAQKKQLAVANICHYAGQCFNPAYLLEAAKYCMKNGATEAADAYYRLILERSGYNYSGETDQSTYISAALDMVSSQGSQTPLDRQRLILTRAMIFSKDTGDRAGRCRLELYLAQVAKGEGQYNEAEFLNNSAWQKAKELNDPILIREAAMITSDFLFWQGKVAEAVSRYEEAIGNLEELPGDETTLTGCATLGWCYGICGQTARGISLIEGARQKALSCNLPQVVRYTEIMDVLTLIDAGRFKEGETILDRFFENPEKDLGNYELWAGYAAKALFFFRRNDLESCSKCQAMAYAKSKAYRWFHHRGPFNFDYMEGLEAAGLAHPEMNIQSEIERLKNWPDIYMQGVGLRYEAQRMFKKGEVTRKMVPVVDKAIDLLSQAGAKIELSHTRVLKAKILLGTGDEKRAKIQLNKAWQVFSGVNPKLFPDRFLPFIEADQTEDFFLDILSEVVDAIGTVKNHHAMLTRIITLVLKLTKAGRGGIFLGDRGGIPKLAAARNIEATNLTSKAFEMGYNLVKTVFREGQFQLTEGTRPGEKSKFRAGWQMAYPVRNRDRVLGVIYIDNSPLWAAPPKECRFALKIIAGQLAVALENADAYKEIARLKERLEDETQFYRKEIEAQPYDGDIVGRSKKITTVLAQIKKVSPTDSSVLILGETGVGKELVAKAIHRSSNRKNGPFIPINSAALDPGLIASELFGHEKGAFTGAARQRRGRFELAHGGTLFLDDIDTLSMDIQAKILRALQEKEFERVGGDNTIYSDFRLLAATNQNLEELIEKGRFRQDLYFRLKVFPIEIPPLRERKEDIPVLATYFLNRLNQKFGKGLKGLTRHQVKSLANYKWAGNIRELKHVMERAVILSEGKKINLPPLEDPVDNAPGKNIGKILPMKEMERNHILNALAASKGKVSGKGGAAEKLEMKPPTLYARIKKLGIEKNYSR